MERIAKMNFGLSCKNIVSFAINDTTRPIISRYKSIDV